MGKTKRVLQVIGVVCGGGVEAVVMNYYRNIDRSKVQFDFVVDGFERTRLDDEIEALGGRVYHVEPYRSNIFSNMHQIYRIVRDGGYEIVHSHMNTLAVFSLFSAWLAGAKIRILHNHSTAVRSEGMRTVVKYLLRPFAPFFANRYAACSRLAGVWMYGQDAVETGRVKVFNNAVNVYSFAFNAEKREQLRQQLMIAPNQFVMGHVGRFVYQKNHLFLLEIFAAVHKREQKAVLLLVGDGPLRKEMEQQVATLGLKGAVRFLGLRKDVEKLYNAMDVFVLPSWYEGLPVVSVEAQANGLPCLVSDRVSEECELTSSLQFLSLEAGAEAWAEFICTALCERNYRATEELREHQFDIKTEAGKMLDWYGI